MRASPWVRFPWAFSLVKIKNPQAPRRAPRALAVGIPTTPKARGARLGAWCNTSSMSDLAALEQRAQAELAACGDEAALRAWHTKYFGKSGEVLQALKGVGAIPADQKRSYGQEANRIKQALTQAYEARLADAKQQALDRSLTAE